jgi:hypothetical protein
MKKLLYIGLILGAGFVSYKLAKIKKTKLNEDPINEQAK